MEWLDEGIVIQRRRHGETAAIVTLFTRAHGRHAGLVRGGAGRRAGGLYQPGTLVSARWRARLPEHLGWFVCELGESFAARLLDDAARLDALGAICGIVDVTLPEGEPHAKLFAATLDLLAKLERDDWMAGYVRWELLALADLGFGLDLSECAATGANENLAFVSPRTGRAVSAAAGRPYADRLLRLPDFLVSDAGPGLPALGDVIDGLKLTGHFLEQVVLAPHQRRIPAARTRLVERLERISTISGNDGTRTT